VATAAHPQPVEEPGQHGAGRVAREAQPPAECERVDDAAAVSLDGLTTFAAGFADPGGQTPAGIEG
jgi:hypothetical protein